MDLVDRRSHAADDDFPGGSASAGDRQHVADRLGYEDRVAVGSLADHLVELPAVAPWCFMQIVRRQEHGASEKSTGIAQGADRFHGRGDSRFHVGGAAAGEPAVVNRRRDERQVDRVEVTIKLERRSRAATLEPDHDGRRLGISGGRPLDLESIGPEDFRQPVTDSASLAGSAGHFDQSSRRLDQPLAVHVGSRKRAKNATSMRP